MDTHNELKAMMDINLKPKFELAINEVIEKSYKADIEKLGPGMAGLVKCQWEEMKPYLFFAYCLGAKAQAVPKGFVVVPAQCPNPVFADMLLDELSKNAIGEFGYDLMIHFSDIDEEKIWGLMLEAAQEPAND